MAQVQEYHGVGLSYDSSNGGRRVLGADDAETGNRHSAFNWAAFLGALVAIGVGLFVIGKLSRRYAMPLVNRVMVRMGVQLRRRSSGVDDGVETRLTGSTSAELHEWSAVQHQEYTGAVPTAAGAAGQTKATAETEAAIRRQHADASYRHRHGDSKVLTATTGVSISKGMAGSGGICGSRYAAAVVAAVGKRFSGNDVTAAPVGVTHLGPLDAWTTAAAGAPGAGTAMTIGRPRPATTRVLPAAHASVGNVGISSHGWSESSGGGGVGAATAATGMAAAMAQPLSGGHTHGAGSSIAIDVTADNNNSLGSGTAVDRSSIVAVDAAGAGLGGLTSWDRAVASFPLASINGNGVGGAVDQARTTDDEINAAFDVIAHDVNRSKASPSMAIVAPSSRVPPSTASAGSPAADVDVRPIALLPTHEEGTGLISGSPVKKQCYHGRVPTTYEGRQVLVDDAAAHAAGSAVGGADLILSPVDREAAAAPDAVTSTNDDTIVTSPSGTGRTKPNPGTSTATTSTSSRRLVAVAIEKKWSFTRGQLGGAATTATTTTRAALQLGSPSKPAHCPFSDPELDGFVGGYASTKDGAASDLGLSASPSKPCDATGRTCTGSRWAATTTTAATNPFDDF